MNNKFNKALKASLPYSDYPREVIERLEKEVSLLKTQIKNNKYPVYKDIVSLIESLNK